MSIFLLIKILKMLINPSAFFWTFSLLIFSIISNSDAQLLIDLFVSISDYFLKINV